MPRRLPRSRLSVSLTSPSLRGEVMPSQRERQEVGDSTKSQWHLLLLGTVVIMVSGTVVTRGELGKCSRTRPQWLAQSRSVVMQLSLLSVEARPIMPAEALALMTVPIAESLVTTRRTVLNRERTGLVKGEARDPEGKEARVLLPGTSSTDGSCPCFPRQLFLVLRFLFFERTNDVTALRLARSFIEPLDSNFLS